MEELPILRIDVLAEYIFNRLIMQGIVVKREDIENILDLQFEYLEDNGFVVPVDFDD